MTTLKVEMYNIFKRNAAISTLVNCKGLDLAINIYRERGVRYFDVMLRDKNELTSYMRAAFHDPAINVELTGYDAPRRVNVYIKSLHVYPAYRRSGYGSALMQGLVSWLDKRCLVAFLDMQSQSPSLSSDDLVEFYKRFGFVVMVKSETGELASMERQPKSMTCTGTRKF